MAVCARFPYKAYYFSFRHANMANSGISRKYAEAGKLDGRPAPYRCNSMGVEHWHIGREPPTETLDPTGARGPADEGGE